MKRKNKSLYKLLLIAFIILTLVLSLVSLKQIFTKKSGVLLNRSELTMVKSFFTQKGIFDGSSLELIEIQGNKNILNLKFTHPSLSGHYYTYYALYDTKKNKLINTLEYKKDSINLLSNQYIGQIDDNVFLTINNKGVLYSLNFTTSTDYEVRMLAELNISKNDIQDIMAVENKLYILTRDYLNEFNERTLSSGKVYTITFDKKYKKANISKIELEEDTVPVKFILNGERNVGYITIDTLDVPIEYCNTYSTLLDKDYLSKTASRNNNYRLLKLDSYKITFFDGSVINIDDSHYSIEKTTFITKTNKDYKFKTGAIFGIPIFIDSKDNKLILTEDYLHNSISYHNPPKESLIYSITDNEIDYGKYNMNFISFSSSLNDKYIGYIYTDIGTIAILKDGSYKRITVKGTAFVDKKTVIFENNGSIGFAKTV